MIPRAESFAPRCLHVVTKVEYLTRSLPLPVLYHEQPNYLIFVKPSHNTLICGLCITMPERKLLDRVSDVARLKHLSLRTEETYRSWIKRFILFHGKRHPQGSGPRESGVF